MNLQYFYNNAKSGSSYKRFKCYTCGSRFSEYKQIVQHTTKYHSDLIEGQDIDIYLYNMRNPPPHLCIVCKTRDRVWNPKKRRYNMLCDNPECKRIYRERFSERMKKIYGTDNLLSDPERQLVMLENRKISHPYTFADGTVYTCIGKYELDYLNYCEHELKLTPEDVVPAPPSTYLKYYNPVDKKNHIYIPDFYMPKYNLVIEIKDGSKYPIESKYRAELKCKAVVKNNKYNYIKIVDKNYKDYVKLLDSFRDYEFTETNNDKHIFIIPKSNTEII